MSIKRLQKMIDSGNNFTYRDNIVRILSFNTIHNEITVNVEINGVEQSFVKESEAKLDLFLDCFKEIAATEPMLPANTNTETKPNEIKLPLIYTESKAMFKELNDILIKDIQKVRDKPEYVGQAKQVCNNISAIVNITKLQLQLLQEG